MLHPLFSNILRTHLREPQPVSIHEQWAREPEILCSDCGDASVSSEGEVCAECLPEHVCATCGGRIDPGDVYCSTECQREDEAYAAADARADMEDAP